MITKYDIQDAFNLNRGFVKAGNSMNHQFQENEIRVYCNPHLNDDELFFVDYLFFILDYDDTKVKILANFAKLFMQKIVNRIKKKEYKKYYKITFDGKILPTADKTIKISVSIYFERKNENR